MAKKNNKGIISKIINFLRKTASHFSKKMTTFLFNVINSIFVIILIWINVFGKLSRIYGLIPIGYNIILNIN
jgi:hypothetical protein